MKREWLTPEGAFKAISLEKQKEMDAEILAEYKAAEIEDRENRLKALEEDAKADKAEVAKLQGEINALKALDYDQLRNSMSKMAETIDKLKKEGVTDDSPVFEKQLKAAWDKQTDTIKSMLEGAKNYHEFPIKAFQSFGDITDGSDFAQMRPGVGEKPVRRVVLRQLFDTIPLDTEFYKYAEVDAVVRDAQNVAKCDWTSSNTKETIRVRSIQTKQVKDIIDFCIKFVNNYPFMESRIRKLVTESVALKVEAQILMGDPTDPDQTNSIDSYASEFDAANPACVLTDKIEKATMVDLILGMQVQIMELGLLNTYMPNVVAVNLCDWFIGVESRKNADGNYLDGRVTYINGLPYIGGMLVVPTPLIPSNTLRVMDSTKGEIVLEEDMFVGISFENRDHWEKEIGSIKAYECLNFLVLNENINAFMKCSDIEAGIEAINKP